MMGNNQAMLRLKQLKPRGPGLAGIQERPHELLCESEPAIWSRYCQSGNGCGKPLSQQLTSAIPACSSLCTLMSRTPAHWRIHQRVHLQRWTAHANCLANVGPCVDCLSFIVAKAIAPSPHVNDPPLSPETGRVVRDCDLQAQQEARRLAQSSQSTAQGQSGAGYAQRRSPPGF